MGWQACSGKVCDGKECDGKSCEGKVCWEGQGIKVCLEKGHYTPDCLKDLCRSNGVEIADAFVYEWDELWVRVESENAKTVRKVCFGDDEATQHGDEWRYTFRNYLGKSILRLLDAGGNEILRTDPIEVVSEKTLPREEQKRNPDDPLFHPNSLCAVVDDLIQWLVTLPFDVSSPTAFGTVEEARPPAPLFVLHVLAHNATKICHALQTILRNPHRRLVVEERWVRIDEASSVDADTVLMMLQHPEHLHPYRGTALATLSQRLKGKVPIKVFEQRVTETLDTPENRFIKHFVDTVLFWCEELGRLDYWRKAKAHRSELGQLYDFVRFVRADQLFTDVGEMALFPASSQVLLKRDGYRECLEVYRLLHLARIPFFACLQDAMDNRRVDKLYEFWCFFRLAEELSGGDLTRTKIVVREGEQGGLRYEETCAELPGGYRLVYNQTFRHKEGSYSVPLRPDFSLFEGDKLVAVFDAKFRFDVQDIRYNRSLDEEMDEATQKGDVERLAKHADIVKMHAYRDALQCCAALVLYPGNQSCFFRTDGTISDKIAVRAIVQDFQQGVGAVPMVPNQESTKND